MAERVHIDSMAFGGYGVGRLASGKVVLVDGAAAGDTLSVRIEREKGSHCFASVVAIDEPSPERIDPACRDAGRCGGCPWQHISLAAQRSWKRALLAGELARAGVPVDPGSIPEPAGSPGLGFRTRTRLHLRGSVLGPMRRRTRTPLPFSSCPILAPALEKLCLETAEAASLERLPDADVELTVDSLGQRGMLVELTRRREMRGWERLASDLGVYSLRIRRPGSPAGPEGTLLYEDSAGTPLAFEPGVFVQTNRTCNARLVSEVLDASGGGRRFAEVYAGAGNLTVHLASRFESGLATESDRTSARMLARNLRSVPSRVEVACETDAMTAARLPRLPRPDLLVADPPRSGLGALLPFLDESPPPRLVMVSCHPVTAARDLGLLASRAGYGIGSLVPLDMFPQTDHLEIVAGLAHGGSAAR